MLKLYLEHISQLVQRLLLLVQLYEEGAIQNSSENLKCFTLPKTFGSIPRLSLVDIFTHHFKSVRKLLSLQEFRPCFGSLHVLTGRTTRMSIIGYLLVSLPTVGTSFHQITHISHPNLITTLTRQRTMTGKVEANVNWSDSLICSGIPVTGRDLRKSKRAME